jgi:hypothetical protein
MRTDFKKTACFEADRSNLSPLIRSGIGKTIMEHQDVEIPLDAIHQLLMAILSKTGATIELRIATYSQAKGPMRSERDNPMLSPAMNRHIH